MKFPPIFFHWTIPIIVLISGGFTYFPGFSIANLLIIIFHEIGHAFAAIVSKCKVTKIMIYGFGGFCSFEGNPSPRERFFIFSGGILGQIILFLISWLYFEFWFHPNNVFWVQISLGLELLNVFIIFLNLIPIRPFDGAEILPTINSIAWYKIDDAPRPQVVSSQKIIETKVKVKTYLSDLINKSKNE